MQTKKEANPAVKTKRVFLTVAIGVILPVALCTAYVLLAFGSIKNAISFSKGIRILVEPAAVKLDDGRLGETRNGKVTIQNLGFSKISILGVESNCECTSTDKMPIELNPKETKELNIKMHLESLGQVEQQLIYYTTSPSVPKFTVKVRVAVQP
jgi:hypothetical protein